MYMSVCSFICVCVVIMVDVYAHVHVGADVAVPTHICKETHRFLTEGPLTIAVSFWLIQRTLGN